MREHFGKLWHAAMVAFLISGAAACSTAVSSKGGVGGTDAGNDGTGGSDAVTGGVGGISGSGGEAGQTGLPHRLDPNTATEYQACAYYIELQARRRLQDCNRQPEEEVSAFIDRILYLCPWSYFSDGANVTVAWLIACADAWRDYPCSEVNMHLAPNCGVPPGDRQEGDSCIGGLQCASKVCRARTGECGVCAVVPVAEPGGACSYDDSGPACPLGYECNQTTDVCTTVPVAGVEPGQPCERFGSCVYGYYCPEGGSLPKVCRAFAQLGDACVEGDLCRDSQCVDGVCVPVPDDQGAPAGATCDLGDSRSCATGLICMCPMASCTAEASGICANARHLGESCGLPQQLCLPGLECRNGTCTEVPGYNQFALLCGQ